MIFLILLIENLRIILTSNLRLFLFIAFMICCELIFDDGAIIIFCGHVSYCFVISVIDGMPIFLSMYHKNVHPKLISSYQMKLQTNSRQSSAQY